MSRSNPNENGSPNPAVRWFEWNGEHGTIRYYDKDKKENVVVGSDFTFMLLDQLGSVRGWHEPTESAIYSNEVKDTRQSALVVKAFKSASPLVEGLYKDIKDRVNTLGGQFVANCYIAFKDGTELKIGSLRFKGAALGAWMDFTKTHRAELYTKAIRINSFTEGKKGKVIYRVPVFQIQSLTEETNQAATALDVTFQAFLKSYLAKNTRDQVDAAPAHLRDEDVMANDHTTPITAEEIPF